MCPFCAGEGMFLGLLGRLLWFRCQNCGGEYSYPDDEPLAIHDAATEHLY